MPVLHGRHPRRNTLLKVDLNDAPEAERLRRVWEVHEAAAWPDSVEPGGDETWDAAGVAPVLLDADVAGVVSAILASRRPPDTSQQALLASCLQDLEQVWPVVPSAARPYFQRLRDMASLALKTAGWRS